MWLAHSYFATVRPVLALSWPCLGQVSDPHLGILRIEPTRSNETVSFVALVPAQQTQHAKCKMANFQTHITTSSVLGVAYGVVGVVLGVPITSAVIGGGLCSLAGMLPDLDSGSGIPVRETTNLAAAIAPILLLDRFTTMGLGHEEMVVAAGGVYLLIRFVVARAFKNYTVHRGMWHSVPAAFIAAAIGFMLCSCNSNYLQWYKAIAVFLGFMSHLVLDELNSLEVRRGRLRIKKSFGTAIKFWSRRSWWANVSTYGKLVLVLALASGDRMYFDELAREFLGDIGGKHIGGEHGGHDHNHEAGPDDKSGDDESGDHEEDDVGKPIIRNRAKLMRR